MQPASPQSESAAIDQFYLETVHALQKSDEAALRRLIRKVDALPARVENRDPCLIQKRRQLLPILMSLAIIDGLPDRQEQKDLQAEALRDLISLGESSGASPEGDLCFGRGFPPVLSDEP